MSEATRIPELFGSLVFNERTMEQYHISIMPSPAVSGKGGFRLNIAQPFSSCKKKLPHFHNFVHTAHPVSLK